MAIMKRQLLLSATALAAGLGYVIQAEAAVLRVPSAFPTIRGAAAVAVAGDTILVAPGRYDESSEPLPGINLLGGVALISEAGRYATEVIGPGLGTAWDPPHLPCLIQGFHFVPAEGRTAGLSNAGEGTEMGHCRLDGGGGQGENFTSQRGLTIHDCELTGCNINLGGGQSGRVFSLVRNVIDGLGTDLTLFLGGSNLFVIRSNTFLVPRAIFGDGLALPPTAHVEVVNNIFYAPPEAPQDFACAPQAAFDIRYNCFKNMHPYQCPLGPTNLIADPLLCDFWRQDYRLRPDSPCIGAGEGGVTMGALGVGCGAAGLAESAAPRTVQFIVEPNPVSSTAMFTVPSGIESPVISIYDPTGRLVDTLRPAGGRLEWRLAPSASGGVYFARLSGGGISETARFILLH